MKFDDHGHVIWTPKTLYELAKTDPQKFVNRYLMSGTPWAFAKYAEYSSTRTGSRPERGTSMMSED
jgi:hypothetical protein